MKEMAEPIRTSHDNLRGSSAKHPSFGVIRFSRTTTSGRKYLFGSRIEQHPTYISLVVSRAERQHRLGADHFYDCGDIIRVEMSAAQFAELLTTMNHGSGVPCTLRFAEGKGIDPPEFDDVEHRRVTSGFSDEMKELGKQATKIAAAAREILAKPGSITKSDRKEINNTLDKLVRWAWDSAPFALDMFNEATDRITTEAKAEVDAFLTQVITQIGLDRTHRGFGPMTDIPELEEHHD